MSIAVVFAVFALIMGISLVLNISMIIPLTAGFVMFTVLACRRGFTLKKVLGFACDSLRESLIVVQILLIIGCLTGMWRLSGTVAYFVAGGISLIPPRMFILACFLLSGTMAYALGTSFGVTATAGVILISIARAGGVSPMLAAGAILSGAYVGDRGAPASSSANLVAVMTHTDIRDNVRQMLRTALVPTLICIVLYGVCSFVSPLETVNSLVLDSLGSEFRLGAICLIPAAVMVILPFCGLSIKLSMFISLASSVAAAMTVQHSSIGECVSAMLTGYDAADPELASMISGGGITSMLEVCVILIISCSYGNIFQGTGMLDPLKRRLEALAEKIGRFPVALLMGTGLCVVFCNQTIGVIMQSNLTESLYEEEEKTAKMLDIENSVILVSGLVPWCIACSVPLAMLDADVRCLPFMFYLWIVPLWWLLKERTEYTGKKASRRQ